MISLISWFNNLPKTQAQLTNEQPSTMVQRTFRIKQCPQLETELIPNTTLIRYFCHSRSQMVTDHLLTTS